jgi:NIPSNAP
MVGDHAPTLSVLMPFGSLEQAVGYEAALDGDRDFLRAADAYLNSPATDASYVRRESALLAAFPNVPRIEVPAATAAKGPRLFELRMYESHSEAAQRKKMSMFTEMGEMEIFRKSGLTPVFFARTLIGPRQPNFVYMLVHESLAAREKNWDAFRTNPDWKKLASAPGFSDAEILTNITTTFMQPAAYSQI